MFLFTTSLHIVLCAFLILVILLQPGKGSDIGAAFGGGGGSSTVFGPRGPGSLLTRATTVVAVLFMVTSITLAIYSDQRAAGGGKIEDELLESGLGEIDWGIPEEPAASGDGSLELPTITPEETPILQDVLEEITEGADEGGTEASDDQDAPE